MVRLIKVLLQLGIDLYNDSKSKFEIKIDR